MSAYITQTTEFNDQECLLEALKQKGYAEVEVCETPQPLVAYQGDYRTADGQGHTKDVSKAMHADIIIRRKVIGGASNDIGFKKNKEGKYEMTISQYDSSKHNQKWVDSLKQEYAVIKAKKIAKKQGMKLLKETNRDGNIVLKYVKA